jgi:hypothetical protein
VILPHRPSEFQPQPTAYNGGRNSASATPSAAAAAAVAAGIAGECPLDVVTDCAVGCLAGGSPAGVELEPAADPAVAVGCCAAVVGGAISVLV